MYSYFVETFPRHEYPASPGMQPGTDIVQHK